MFGCRSDKIVLATNKTKLLYPASDSVCRTGKQNTGKVENISFVQETFHTFEDHQ